MGQELAILLSARDQASRVLNQVGQSAQQLSTHLNQGLGGAIRTLGSIAGAPARALGGLVDVFGKVGLAVFGVKETIEVFKGAIKGLVGPAEEMEKRQAQLNAVIKSTGGVAGVTAGAANDLAESLSKVTTFSAASNLETENLLLTFTNIGKNIFPQATETVLNMATALGEDTKSAAIQLGKALQDPVLGITALRRVGVNFSDAQKEVVKQMVATGNTAGAQALIMKELQTEFGNSARAAGETFPGKLAILSNQFEHMKEVVGGAILPVLSQLLDTVTPLLTQIGDALPGAITVAEDALGRLGDAITSVWTVVQPFAAGLLDIGQTLASGDFSGALDKAGEMLGGIVDSISGWVSGDGPGQIRDALLGLADSAWQWLQVAAGHVGDALQANIVIPVKNWVAVGGLTRLEGSLLGLAAGAWTWLQGVAGQAASFLDTNLVGPVRDWVTAGGIGNVADALIGLAQGAWDWIKGAAGTAGAVLDTNLTQPVRDWVAQGGIGKMADALVGLADGAWSWVTTAAGKAGDFLGSITAAIGAWNSGVGQTPFANAFIGFVNHAWDWVQDAVASASDFLGHLVDAAAAWVSGGGIGNMVTGLARLADSAWVWVSGAAATASDFLGGLVNAAADWVKQGGIGNMATALGDLATRAWDWTVNAASWAGIHLSALITAIGEWATQTAVPWLLQAGQTLGQTLYDGLDAGFKAAVEAGHLQPGLDALAKGIEQAGIPDNTRLSWLLWGDTLQRVDDLLKRINIDMGATGSAVSAGKIIDAIASIWVFEGGVLAKVAEEMALQINELARAFQKIADGKDNWVGAIRDVMKALFQPFQDMTGFNPAAWATTLIESITSAVKKVIDTDVGMFNAAVALGTQMVNGLIAGISANLEPLKTAVTNLGQALPQWLKDVLQISSPSRVTYDIGIEIGQGLINGIGAQAPGVEAATANMTGKVVQVFQKAQQQIHGILVKIRDDYSAMIEMGGGPPPAPHPPSHVPPPGGASGTPNPGGGPPSQGVIPNYYPPQPNPWNGQAGPAKPGFGGGATVMGPYGPYIPSFDHGGMVPGYRGKPMLAIVHGGETVTPPGNGAGLAQHFYGDLYVTGPSMLDALSTLSEMTR